MATIVDVVVADKNLATMLTGLKAAGLEPVLSHSGPFTVFAPSNRAFRKLASGELADWLKPENGEKLATILKYHIIQGKIYFKDFKDGQKLKTVNGKELDVTIKGGNVTINEGKLQRRDTHASNGVVHCLDTVIFA